MRFEKISYEQAKIDGLENYWDNLKLPKRATMGSAGHDIFAPYDFTLYPGKEIKFPTGMKIKLDKSKFLMIVPRSGLGFKYGVQLSNTVGIIDADYYNNPKNEGHIWVKLSYPILDKHQQSLTIHAGDAVCQGIVLPYYKLENDTTDETRNGGFGSTDNVENDTTNEN